ncbi:DUF29 family protein [Crocosphaera sp. Alani8]|uniref:DUF29 family protein n=1 Tax=Crocosphaera sp. Alani8 TaxID=3038952 RepID=UPI00313C4CB8
MINSGDKDNKKNRFWNFAVLFKRFITVSTIVAAMLPLVFKQFEVIPIFEVHNQFLPIYTSLFCFLILAFCFYARHRLAWWMFHNELNGADVGLAKEIKTAFKFIPFFLIGICFACIIWYHNILYKSVATIRCDLTNPPCDVKRTEFYKDIEKIYKKIETNYSNQKTAHDKYLQAHKKYINSNPQDKAENNPNHNTYIENHDEYLKAHDKYLKVHDEYMKELNLENQIENSLQYFGQSLTLPLLTDIENFQADQVQLNSDFILRYADPSVIDEIERTDQDNGDTTDQKNRDTERIKSSNSESIISTNSQLIISYLGIFITAQIAFILMALREYLQDILDKSDLLKNANGKKLTNSICGDINNKDSREICYLFLEANAKSKRNYAQKNIIKTLKEEEFLSNKQRCILFWLSECSNYRQNIINDILKNKYLSDTKEMKAQFIEDILGNLRQLKKAFEILHKWERVTEVEEIINRFNKVRKERSFQYFQQYFKLLAEKGKDEKKDDTTDYYSGLETFIELMPDIKAIDENNLDWNKLLNELSKNVKNLKEKKENETKDNLKKVIAGLLQYTYQKPEPRKAHQALANSINEHRQKLKDDLKIKDDLKTDFKTNSSLKKYCQRIFSDVYSEARKLASTKTELSLHEFPEYESAPFNFEEALHKDYLEISSKENLKRLIVELLKYTYQKPGAKKAYQALVDSIKKYRQNLEYDFQTSPKLKDYCEKEEIFRVVYSEARKLASTKTEPSLDKFPEYESAPFDFEDALHEDYLKISCKENLKRVIIGLFLYDYLNYQESQQKKDSEKYKISSQFCILAFLRSRENLEFLKPLELLLVMFLPTWNAKALVRSIREHRENLYRDFDTKTNTESYCEEIFEEVYGEFYSEVRELAQQETGILLDMLDRFPQSPPFSCKQALDVGYLKIGIK